MPWINVDRSTGVWKLHKELCRYCTPQESKNKGLEELKKDGGWIQADSYEAAYEFFKTNQRESEYWQPCKVCKPGP